MFAVQDHEFDAILSNIDDFPYSWYKSNLLALETIERDTGSLNEYNPAYGHYSTLYLLVTDAESIKDLQKSSGVVDIHYMILSGVSPACLADVPKSVLDELRGLYLLSGSDEPMEEDPFQESIEIHLPRLTEYVVYSGVLDGSGVVIKFNPSALEVLGLVTDSSLHRDPFEIDLRPFDGSMSSLKVLEFSDHFSIDLRGTQVPKNLEEVWYRGDEHFETDTLNNMMPHLSKSESLSTISFTTSYNGAPVLDLKSLGSLPKLQHLHVDSVNGLPSELNHSRDLAYLSVQFKHPESGDVRISSECLKFPELKTLRIWREPTKDDVGITYEDRAFDELIKCDTLKISVNDMKSLDPKIHELHLNHSLKWLELACANPLLLDDIISKSPKLRLTLDYFTVDSEEQDAVADLILHKTAIVRSPMVHEAILNARRRFSRLASQD